MKKLILTITIITLISCAPNNRKNSWEKTTTTTVVTTVVESYRGAKDTTKISFSEVKLLKHKN